MVCERCGNGDPAIAFDADMSIRLPVNIPVRLWVRCQRDYVQQTIIAPVAANAALYANLVRSEARLALLDSQTARMEDYTAVADYRVAAEKAAATFTKTFLTTPPAWAVTPVVPMVFP